MTKGQQKRLAKLKAADQKKAEKAEKDRVAALEKAEKLAVARARDEAARAAIVVPDADRVNINATGAHIGMCVCVFKPFALIYGLNIYMSVCLYVCAFMGM
jgi:hypothetical protein